MKKFYEVKTTYEVKKMSVRDMLKKLLSTGDRNCMAPFYDFIEEEGDAPSPISVSWDFIESLNNSKKLFLLSIISDEMEVFYE